MSETKKIVNGWLCALLMYMLALSFCSVASAQVVRYVHTDGLGSVSVLTDTNRNIIERREYEPYGANLGSSVDGVGYTGHVMDAATGLTYMQQRYYDPTVGRFLSTDPVSSNGDTGENFNRYKYASNNPYRFFDPDGRQDRAYGASATLMMTPEQRRIWESGERAAFTEGGRALEGAAMMDAVKDFTANPHITKEGLAQLAVGVVAAKLTHGRSISVGGGAKLSNLSAADLKRIQNAANRSGTTITVVGSRAAGTARSSSDWDYVVNANSKTRNNLSRSLPGSGNMKEAERANMDIFRGEVDKNRPHIEVRPEQ
ncbi:wall-associated protein [Xanthomonas citri pv. malvacearum str. GSPB2388]|uniref:RHS repeat-associated core domain-containing protein n=1 Tax=Xanthomonas citri TaxID=346 RepID=UPI0002974DC7|nr:RHS repeat-associated core domain-containing protein [Xanthomonas citri]EKQ58962.1 wall-associated protein [Xanthomonas citri pv. malvacearum str. GSPB2388]